MKNDVKLSIECLTLAINPTAEQVQRACVAFAARLAELRGQPVTIMIGNVPITRSAP